MKAEYEDEMADYDFDADVMEYNPLFYNEPIHYLQVTWKRSLTDHEKHIVRRVYDWCRHQLEVEELKLLEFQVEQIKRDAIKEYLESMVEAK